MLLRIGQIDGLAPIGDEADEALALFHAQGMNRLLAQPFGREKLKGVVRQPDIDRANLRNHVGGDDFNDTIQLSLGL